MVGLLGATELFGRPCRALTWNTGNCLLFDEVIRNNLTRSDPTRARANSGALRTLWLGPGLEAQGPVTRSPLSLHLHTPRTGALPTQVPTGGWAGERVAGPCGSRRKGGGPRAGRGEAPPPDPPPPPEAAHVSPLQKGLYGLEVAAWCAKEAWVHPPTLDHIIAKGTPP